MIYRSCGGCGVDNKVDVLRKSPFQGVVLKKVQFPDDLKGSENVTINILPEDVGSSVQNIDTLPGIYCQRCFTILLLSYWELKFKKRYIYKFTLYLILKKY